MSWKAKLKKDTGWSDVHEASAQTAAVRFVKAGDEFRLENFAEPLALKSEVVEVKSPEGHIYECVVNREIGYNASITKIL